MSVLGLQPSLSLTRSLHPSEAPLSTQNERAKRCRWWFRASACRVGFGVLRSSRRIIANDRSMSTTFAKVIRSRVNRHGSLLASCSAGSNIQDRLAYVRQSDYRQEAGHLKGCTLDPSSLATVSCRSPTKSKGSVTSRETRHWQSFTAVSTGMAGGSQ